MVSILNAFWYVIDTGIMLVLEKKKDVMITVQEAIEILGLYQEKYIVRKMHFADSFGSRTRVMLWLKKTETILPMMDYHCAMTITDVKEMLQQSKRDYPDGKFVFDARPSGEIHLVFDIKTITDDLRNKPYKTHTKEEAEALPERIQGCSEGSKTVKNDDNLGNICLIIQLEQKREWFLRICFDKETGRFKKYILDYEGKAYESHYEFTNEAAIRGIIYHEGDEEKTLDELFSQFIKDQSGHKLAEIIKPYITAQCNYD